MAQTSIGSGNKRHYPGSPATLVPTVPVSLPVLGKHLNVPVTSYAYPYGEANDLVVGWLGKTGVKLASTVTPGSNPFFAQPLMLHRTMIFGTYDLDAFKTKLQVTRKLGE